MKLRFASFLVLLLAGSLLLNRFGATFDRWYESASHDGFMTFVKVFGCCWVLVIFAIFGETLYRWKKKNSPVSAPAERPTDQTVA